MDSEAEQILIEEFLQIVQADSTDQDTSGMAAGSPAGTGDLIEDAGRAAGTSGPQSVQQALLPPPVAAPPVAAPRSSTGNNANTGKTGSVLTSVLSNAFGVLPLISGIMGLFGGGNETPPPLVKYTPPAQVSFEAALTPDGIMDADYGQSGAVRSYAGQTATALGSPAVQINVQAMDSRSFLDHSQEIAQAVREAMLNLHPINDIVADL